MYVFPAYLHWVRIWLRQQVTVWSYGGFRTESLRVLDIFELRPLAV